MSEIRILKCRHDDHDDPDHHEGKKRRRLELETAVGTFEITPSEQRVKSQVDTLEPAGRASDIQGISMDVGPSVEKRVHRDGY